MAPIGRSASARKIDAMASAAFCALQLPTRRLIVARHGQTAWNREGRIQGQADPPLDQTGRRQARTLALDLDRSGRPSLVVASNLGRARQTAAAIAQAASCPVQFHPGLREADAGDWEGRLRRVVQAQDPNRFADWVSGRRPAPGSHETMDQAGARVLSTLTAIAGYLDAPDRVVVVGHGLALRGALSLLTGCRGPHLANGAWMEVVVPVVPVTADPVLASG